MQQPRGIPPLDHAPDPEDAQTAPTAPSSPRARRQRKRQLAATPAEPLEGSSSTPSPSAPDAEPELSSPSEVGEADAWPLKGRVTFQPLNPRNPAPTKIVLRPVSMLELRWKRIVALTLAGLVLAGALLGVGLLFRRWQVSQILTAARTRAGQHRVSELRAGLAKVNEARELDSHQPAALALAAAIQGELAWRFAEADVRELRALVEESARYGAEHMAAAQRDLALARAYLVLTTSPLPEALGSLLACTERDPQSVQLKLLYGEALHANGELELAQQVLDELPADDPQTQHARALLHWRAGKRELARQELAYAAVQGLSRELVLLEFVRFRIEERTETERTLAHLTSMAGGPGLPRRQRAWCHLLLAELYQRRAQQREARTALDAALSRPPLADLEFHHLAGQVLLELGDLKRAEQQALAAARLSPRNPRVMALLAAVQQASAARH